MKKLKVWQLVLLLVLVVFGSVLFVGAAAGWFSGNIRVVIDDKYGCENGDCEFLELSPEVYDRLAEEGESFVIFVDQPGCHTADQLREFAKKWSFEHGIRFYRMWFSDLKETGLYDSVKYYPSVVLVSRGTAVAWLKADSEDDAAVYSDFGAFSEWMGRYLIADN